MVSLIQKPEVIIRKLNVTSSRSTIRVMLEGGTPSRGITYLRTSLIHVRNSKVST